MISGRGINRTIHILDYTVEIAYGSKRVTDCELQQRLMAHTHPCSDPAHRMEYYLGEANRVLRGALPPRGPCASQRCIPGNLRYNSPWSMQSTHSSEEVDTR